LLPILEANTLQEVVFNSVSETLLDVPMAEKDALEQQRQQPEQVIEEQPQPPIEPPYSVFSKWQKGTFVYIASVAAFASPVSSSIYFPAMLVLAKDLNTSLTNISLTITTYMVLMKL
jgi:hypothetical protein